jgi:hypothetical protein
VFILATISPVFSPRSFCETDDHISIDDVVMLAAWSMGSLMPQNFEEVAVKGLRLVGRV